MEHKNNYISLQDNYYNRQVCDYTGVGLTKYALNDLASEMRILYITHLAKTATAAQLAEIFEEYGKTTSVGIWPSLDSKAYNRGYVVFGNQDVAYMAMACLCDYIFHDVPWRLSFYTDTKAHPFDPNANIIIHNLSPRLEGSALFKTFAQYGIIYSCYVPRLPTGERMGFILIQFESAEIADYVINDVKNRQIDGNVISASKCIAMKDFTEESNKSFTKIVVFNLPTDTVEEEVLEMFKKIGNIVSYKFEKPKQERAPKLISHNVPISPFFSVTYQTHQEALDAIEKYNQTVYADKSLISVSKSYTKNEQEYLRTEYHTRINEALASVDNQEIVMVIAFIPLLITQEELIEKITDSSASVKHTIMIENPITKTYTCLAHIYDYVQAAAIYEKLHEKKLHEKSIIPLSVKFRYGGIERLLDITQLNQVVKLQQNGHIHGHGNSIDMAYDDNQGRHRINGNSYIDGRHMYPKYMTNSHGYEMKYKTNRKAMNVGEDGYYNSGIYDIRTQNMNGSVSTPYATGPKKSDNDNLDQTRKIVTELADLSSDEFKTVIKEKLIAHLNTVYKDDEKAKKDELVTRLLETTGHDGGELLHLCEDKTYFMDTLKALNAGLPTESSQKV